MYSSERAHADPFVDRYGADMAGASGQGPMPDAGLEVAGGAAGGGAWVDSSQRIETGSDDKPTGGRLIATT